MGSVNEKYIAKIWHCRIENINCHNEDSDIEGRFVLGYTCISTFDTHIKTVELLRNLKTFLHEKKANVYFSSPSIWHKNRLESGIYKAVEKAFDKIIARIPEDETLIDDSKIPIKTKHNYIDVLLSVEVFEL